jgi:hypothetical protein
MINPRMLRPAHRRQNNPRFGGGHFYFAILTGPRNTFQSRGAFKKALVAEMYAKRLLARWIRLYDAAIKAATKPTPEPE